MDHVSPIETLPVNFGAEEDVLQVSRSGELNWPNCTGTHKPLCATVQPGEFCEVSNASKTDPCAWFGRVVKVAKNGSYVVSSPSGFEIHFAELHLTTDGFNTSDLPPPG